jgi:hypothetical protein
MSEPVGDAELARHWARGKLSLETTRPREVAQALLERYPNLTSLEMQRPNLESVFLNLTGTSLRD